jgi:hypothetical protein
MDFPFQTPRAIFHASAGGAVDAAQLQQLNRF